MRLRGSKPGSSSRGGRGPDAGADPGGIGRLPALDFFCFVRCALARNDCVSLSFRAKRAMLSSGGAFGFSWRLAIWLWKISVFGGWKSLDFLILSSEMSLFNGLRAIFAQKNSRSPSPGVEGRPGRERAVGGHAEGRNCSWGELNVASDFLQGIVVRPCRAPERWAQSIVAQRVE